MYEVCTEYVRGIHCSYVWCTKNKNKNKNKKRRKRLKSLKSLKGLNYICYVSRTHRQFTNWPGAQQVVDCSHSFLGAQDTILPYSHTPILTYLSRRHKESPIHMGHLHGAFTCRRWARLLFEIMCHLHIMPWWWWWWRRRITTQFILRVGRIPFEMMPSSCCLHVRYLVPEGEQGEMRRDGNGQLTGKERGELLRPITMYTYLCT